MRSDSNAGNARNARKASTPETQNTPLAPREVALAIADAALGKKANDIEIIDVRGKVDYADYVVVMSGRSDRQVNAIARGVQGDLKQQHGVRCNGVEGLPLANWALLDFGDVIVHVFHRDTRGYYDVESLFMDAPRVPFESSQTDDSLFSVD
ncbi:MAG: ribosome silencing factor [Polyangiales bacterium]